MNVTVKINDQLCRDARHRAVDAGLSLSGWVADVIRKELSGSFVKKPQTLLEVLGNEKLAGFDMEFARDKSRARDVKFL